MEPGKVPERVGEYKVVRPLSMGGMAVVYEATRAGLAGVSSRVALKVIRPEHRQSETFRELFINEAKLGAAMAHKNLVQIYNFGQDDDSYFLVMEYVEGVTLRKILSVSARSGRPIPGHIIAEIGRQAAEGLSFAHAAKDADGRPLRLVHRDMKPSNVILTPEGVVRILDFGVSKGALTEEKKGAVRGTWGYMAPEQAAGRDVDGTADVFGLAMVLYELASGKAMFKGVSKETIKQRLADDAAARMATTLDSAMYGPLTSVLVHALQRDPEARFRDAAEFARALAALVPPQLAAGDQLRKFQEDIRRMDSLPSDATFAPVASTPPPRRSTTSLRRRAATWSAGLGLGGVVVAAALLLASDRASTDAAEHGVDVPADVRSLTPEPPRAMQPVETADAPPAVDGVPVRLETTVAGEVFIGGDFAGYTPVSTHLPPGSYTVNLISRIDGRRKVFDMQVEAGTPVHKTWDFERSRFTRK